MAWNTPKYDFLTTDGFTATHANNVGENQYILHQGNSGIATVTMANDLGINMQNQCFYASGAGATDLYRIRYTDGTDTRLIGNIIFIVFENGQGISTSYGTSGNYYGIAGSTFTCAAGDAVGFVLASDSKWHIIRGV